MSELTDALRAVADTLDTNEAIKPPMLAPETCREAAARIDELETEAWKVMEPLLKSVRVWSHLVDDLKGEGLGPQDIEADLQRFAAILRGYQP